MKMIQWRLRKEHRWEAKDKKWKEHSKITDNGNIVRLLDNYNDVDKHFEYRESPAVMT